MFIVVDDFGFAWGDLVDTIEEAHRQLMDIRKDCEARGWNFPFSIERRG